MRNFLFCSMTYVMLHNIPGSLNLDILLVERHRLVEMILEHLSDLAAHHVTGYSGTEFQSEDQQQQNRKLTDNFVLVLQNDHRKKIQNEKQTKKVSQN